MKELGSLALLGAAWVGCLVPVPVPLFVIVPIVLLGVASRRPLLVVALVAILASSLASRSEEAYEPTSRGSFRGEVMVVGDPRAQFFAVTAEVRTTDGTRLLATAPTSSGLGAVVVGQTIELAGRTEPVADSGWLKVRHVVGRLEVEEVKSFGGVAWWMRPANGLRSMVASGGQYLGWERAPLYNGLVVGDDRNQSSSQRALFRSGGLTHLLAVSGQNVAFALAVAGPLLARLGHRQRLGLTLVVLAVFALATRLEPSVLRATATAVLAAWAVQSGRRATGLQTLALACVSLLLIDPFLAHSVGYQLSVAASAAIIVFGPSVAHRVPGPGPLKTAAGVTISAQAGVAPILMSNFGPMSLSSLPANLLAGPAAGLVMTWGLSVGLLAAVVPPAVGRILQWPAGVMVWWISGVATWAGRIPAPRLDGWGAVATLSAGGILWALGRARGRWETVVRVVVLGSLLVAGMVAIPNPANQPTRYGQLLYFPRTATSPSILILPANPMDRDIEGLIEDRNLAVDLVVASGGGGRTSRFVVELAGAVEIGDVLAPPLHRIKGATITPHEISVETPWGPILISPSSDRRHLGVEWPPP